MIKPTFHTSAISLEPITSLPTSYMVDPQNAFSRHILSEFSCPSRWNRTLHGSGQRAQSSRGMLRLSLSLLPSIPLYPTYLPTLHSSLQSMTIEYEDAWRSTSMTIRHKATTSLEIAIPPGQSLLSHPQSPAISQRHKTRSQGVTIRLHHIVTGHSFATARKTRRMQHHVDPEQPHTPRQVDLRSSPSLTSHLLQVDIEYPRFALLLHRLASP